MPKHDPIHVAKDYVERYGARLGLAPHDGTPSDLTLDPELSRRAGAAFEALKHEPGHEGVKAAYEALKKETLLQYTHMTAHGLKIEPWRKEGQPYANSKEMVHDVRENGHLSYFPTDSGFGEGEAFADHPLYEKVPGMDVRYNDLFRAVHDYYAHAQHGHQFGPKGEQRAWHEHARMYSALARKALATETHGQNSWVNFGPHKPEEKPVTERPFADQKAALLPEEVWPKRLARLYHVQPGEALMDGQDFIHEIHDDAGNRLGHVWVQPKDGGETLHINHIGAAGHVPNASGLANVRDVVRQLREHYPNAKRLTGHRVTGRRSGNDVAAKLARGSALAKHTDFWTHLNGIANAQARGEHDAVAHGVMADHIGEMVGNPDDPRAHIVRHADPLMPHPVPSAPHQIVFDSARNPNGRARSRHHNFTVFRDDHMTGGAYHDESPKAYRAGPSEMSFGYVSHNGWTTPSVKWTVYIPRTKSETGKSRTVTFHRVFRDSDELHNFIRSLPKKNQKEWIARANNHGWRDWMKTGRYDQPHRFARDRITPTKPGGVVKPKSFDGPSRPENHPFLPPSSLPSWLKASPAVEKWAIEHASRFVDQFMKQHGYKNRDRALTHLATFMVHAGRNAKKGQATTVIKHPVSGQNIRVTIQKPAKPPFPRSAPDQKLARKKKEKVTPVASDHDQLLRAAATGHMNREFTPMLLLADKLDEDGRPGGNLLRHSYAAKVQRNESAYPQLAYTAHMPEDNARSPDGKMLVRTELTPRIGETGYPVEGQYEPVLTVTHWPDDENTQNTWLRHCIVVRSKAHFRELLKELPRSMQEKLISHMLTANREHHVLHLLPDTAEGDGPVKLARTQYRQDDKGAAMASAGSKNHDARLKVVRDLLKEAGLSPSVVRSALAHDGGQARASFATVVKAAIHPEHLRYTAAWLGLMTGDKRIAVAQPDPDGEDFLHVISVPGTPDHLTDALKSAGIDKFTTEHSDTGTRAYVLNPLGKHPVEKIAAGIQNARHSTARVRVYRLGAGASSDAAGGKSDAAAARAEYRSVIDDFERAAGAS